MARYQTFCLDCQAPQPDPAAFVCAECGGLLGFRYDYSAVTWDDSFGRSMWRYWRLLPVDGPDQIVTLWEGGTPLLRSRRFASAEVYLKDETRNPTGSHKDRPLSVAINHARRVGANTSFVVSTGSTGISNAAMAARAGLRSVVIMTEGTPPARVYPMYALGSTVVAVQGAIDTIIDEVIETCRAHGLYLSSTSRGSNPYQGEGNKTIAYEIVEQLGRAPDWMVVPVGGGGTIAGVLRGFQDLQALGWIPAVPRMVGVVPQHYNILKEAAVRGLETWREVLQLDYAERPPSLLVKLAHNYPPDGMEALDAVRDSQGFFLSISDEDALQAQEEAGRAEGLYVEPSTGACLAGVEHLSATGRLRPGDVVVALVSGSGYRETFVSMAHRPLQTLSVISAELPDTLARLAG